MIRIARNQDKNRKINGLRYKASHVILSAEPQCSKHCILVFFSRHPYTFVRNCGNLVLLIDGNLESNVIAFPFALLAKTKMSRQSKF